MSRWLRLALCLMLMTSAQQGSAHLLNMTNATVELQPGRQLELKLTLDLMLTAGSREAYYELSKKSQSDPAVQQILETLLSAVVLESGNTRIALAVKSIHFAEASRDEYLSPLTWPRADIVMVAVSEIPELITAADLRINFNGSFHFEEPIATTFIVTDSQRSMTRWLVAGQYSPLFSTQGWNDSVNTAQTSSPHADESTPLLAVLAQYLGLGFLHILPEGTDHLLFVLGLCLGSESLRRLLILITLFTLAHTVSLGLVSIGLVPAAPRIVEPLIQLTIMAVAAENLLPRTTLRIRAGLVLCFGLIHGMGFASALLTIGMPANAFLTALFGFNVGVELAQITFILIVMQLLRLVRSQNWYRNVVVRSGSVAIAAMAIFWMVRLLRV